MRFGLAKKDITPKFPMKLACTGNFADDFTGVHDDVYVRCLVIDDGKNKVVFLSFDLLFHSRDLNIAVAEYAEQKYGISPAGMIISYTHAHTAPAVMGYNPGHHNDEYEKILVTEALACIDKAMMSLFEGFLTYGTYQAELNVSRRKMIDGRCETLPDFRRERDTEMFVLCVRDLNKSVRGVLANYACHPVFYPHPTMVSSEFPGRVCQLLDAEYYGCISLYTQSAAGDVKPMPTAIRKEDGTSEWNWNMKFSDIDEFAKKICRGVSALISSDKMKKTDIQIKCDEFEIKAGIERAPKEHFQMLYTRFESQPHNPVTVNCKRILNGQYEKLPDHITIKCSTVKLSNDLYIATMGGEPCFGVKTIVKSAFKNRTVCFIGYTDSCAYIVDDKVLQEGGYEPESYPEYGLAGHFRMGIDSLFYNGYLNSFERINTII